MLEIYKWLVFIAATFFTSFGILANLKNRASSSNKLFGLLSFFFAFWSYSWFALLSIEKSTELALLWARLLNIGAIMIPIAYLHWILSVLELSKKRRPVLFCGYLITAIFLFFGFSDKFIKGVHSIYFFPFWPTPGVLYKWFLLFCFGCMVSYAIFLLVREIAKNKGERKYQLVYILVGSLLGFGGGITNFPLMYGYGFPPLGIFLVIGGPLALNYAVIKHHLMDLKVIATEVLCVLMGVILFIDALLFRNRPELILKLLLLVPMIFFGWLLVRGVLNEIKSKQEMATMAENLRKANVELQKIDQVKTEFLNLASHQLRTPTSVIKGIASMMKEGTFFKLPQDKRDTFIDGLFEKSLKLENIINDILNASEMTSTKFQISPQQAEWLEPRSLMEEIIKEFEPKLLERQISLKLDAPGNFSRLWGEKRFLKEALGNIIDNAIKYTPSAKADNEIRTKREGRSEISVSLKEEEGEIVFRVRDNGIGIPPGETENLFKKFKRASNARNMYTDGSGLGLFIVKEIIEGHGGRVWVQSELDKGSDFFVALPVRAAKEMNISQYIQRQAEKIN